VSHFIRYIVVLLISASLMQGAWAQFNFTVPGFVPDENGTNLDDPQLKKVAPKVAAGTSIKDCAECPEMVVVPAGGFMMGSSARVPVFAYIPGVFAENTAWEIPQRYVKVPSFAAGRYAVTKGEFAAFVRSSGYSTEAEHSLGCGTEFKLDSNNNWLKVGFAQGDDHPVVCVSWNDAQAYIQWLNRISGKSYRLLSEAEREYAARGGTQTAFWWGDSITTSQANYNGNGSYNGSPKGQYRQATVPVNSFSANPFGLYNVHGNVLEWSQDCWHENYTGAPTDGSAWITGCTTNDRVLRGGSWAHHPENLRSALRTSVFLYFRDSRTGFRLARDL
jgi:formylglycine-generating enzyme required for sulfatase activity